MTDGKKDPVEILAHTINEQGKASQAQAEALGRIQQSVQDIQTSVSEVKNLIGLIKDKSEELHRKLDSSDRDHKEFAVQLGAVNHLVMSLERKLSNMLILTRDEVENVVTAVCHNIDVAPTSCPNQKVIEGLIGNNGDNRLNRVITNALNAHHLPTEDDLREAVTNGVNASIISIMKKKWFWMPIIIFMLLLLTLVGIKTLEIGNFIKIGNLNPQSSQKTEKPANINP